jgi:hypothetical protein
MYVCDLTLVTLSELPLYALLLAFGDPAFTKGHLAATMIVTFCLGASVLALTYAFATIVFKSATLAARFLWLMQMGE